MDDAASQDATLTDEAVRALCQAAGLNLPAEHLEGVASTLRAWLPGQLELARKMSQPDTQEIIPITAFEHANQQEGVE